MGFKKRTTRRHGQKIQKLKQVAIASIFIILALLINQLIIKFDLFKKPTKEVAQTQPLSILVYLNYLEPTLSLSSSQSASLRSPVLELDNFTSSLSAQTYNLFPNGDLIPGEDNSTSIKLLFSEKPLQQKLKQIFILITSVNRALPITKGYLLKDSLYIATSNLPDIIMKSDYKEEELSKALQVIPSLAKIKDNTKIIDLRFNNPTIR
jgi:hypothetical protein